MTLKVAPRADIAPFFAMEVMRAANRHAAAGADVLHLEVGEPVVGAPPRVIEAAHAALDSTALGYSEALGLPELRARIARHYRDVYRVEVDAARVVVTAGASGAFLLAFLAAFDAGDRVALADPGYPAYRNILKALGIEVVALAAGPEHRFQPTPALLEEAGELDGLIVASPSNPTGTMLGAGELTALASWCDARGVRLISDEIYHGITYGAPATTALESNPDCVVINSFSKYFAMTGWRIGWMVVPEELLTPVERLAQNLFVSPAALAQRAALVALGCRAELDAYVEVYARNLALLLERLPEAGFDRLAPADGAFYIYADTSALAADSQDFCARMLEETGVATTPGIDFDPRRGHGSIRISFAGDPADIAAATERLIDWRAGRK
jgi:aspartate/methionine/tyrosine aminotransferase